MRIKWDVSHESRDSWLDRCLMADGTMMNVSPEHERWEEDKRAVSLTHVPAAV